MTAEGVWMFTECNYPLRQLNSFGLDVVARAYVDAHKPSDIECLYRSSLYSHVRKLVLGGGSNVLFLGDVDGLVVRLCGFNHLRLAHRRDGSVSLDVGAGVPWSTLVEHCLDEGYAGLERLGGIPGTVGAAPIQNIGAYGSEVGQRIESVSAYDGERHEFVVMPADACGFAYRDSIFKSRHPGRFVITQVRFVLDRSRVAPVCDDKVAKELGCAPSSRTGLRDIKDAVCRIRSRRLPDPQALGNAGSFFVNPTVPLSHALALDARFPGMPQFPQALQRIKLSAGWLIEQCGFRGERTGKVGVYQHNPLVVVNHGGASGAEIYSFGLKLREAVLKRFNVALVMEPFVVGARP